MEFFKIDSWKKVLIHLGIILGLVLLSSLSFIYIFLPNYTNHGETITVPSLEGIPFSEIDEFLTKRKLSYEVLSDSSYSSEHPPLTILQQEPKAGAKVKEKRKIYISLNATTPPKVKMPRLIDSSLKNAQMTLKSYGLILGEITYVPDLAANAVLEQHYNGNKILDGAYIPKGARIDLVVGNGFGKRDFPMPDLLGQHMDDALFNIIGSGLQKGTVFQEMPNTDQVDNAELLEPGMVYKQSPKAGENIRVGEFVDIWIVPIPDFEEGQEKGFGIEKEI